MRQVCPTCHWPALDVTDRYCWRDGTRLVDGRVCSCGATLGAVDHFCSKCGAQAVEPVTQAKP